MENQRMELAIYNVDDRLKVAAILVKNGYKVWQGKRQKTPSGKTVDYILIAEEAEDKVTTR